MSVRLEAFDRAHHQRELRRCTDTELILAGRQVRTLVANAKMIVSPNRESPSVWHLRLEDVIAEWRARQASRRVGESVCLCHVPGSQPITPNAQMWQASGYDVWIARTLGLHHGWPRSRMDASHCRTDPRSVVSRLTSEKTRCC